MKYFSLMTAIIVVLLLCVLCAGCGGGGEDKPSLHGTTTINAAAERPRVCILDVDYEGGGLYAVSSAPISQSSYGWQTKQWMVPLPDRQGSVALIPCVFNDINADGEYSGSGELLGFPKTSTGKYITLIRGEDNIWMYEDADGHTVASNAENYSLFIECQFTRSAKLSPAGEERYVSEKLRDLRLKSHSD